MEQMTLTKMDISAMLGICPKSVENHEAAGDLPKSFKLGCRRYWWKNEIIEHINQLRGAV